jgi:hypothetical protein
VVLQFFNAYEGTGTSNVKILDGDFEMPLPLLLLKQIAQETFRKKTSSVGVSRKGRETIVRK